MPPTSPAIDRPTRLAIVTAVKSEFAPLTRILTAAPEATPRLDGLPALLGELAGMRVLLACGGVGNQRSSRAAQAIIDAWRPDAFLMAGVAGALDPSLRIGDVVVADRVVVADTLSESLPTLRIEPGEGRAGALLCADRVLVTPEEKRVARERHQPQPLAVEMETVGLAKVAVEAGIPWGAVRAVSDTVDEGLPLDFNRYRTEDGDLPTSAVALAALLHPTAIPGLIRLGTNTRTAAESLAGFLRSTLTRSDVSFLTPAGGSIPFREGS